MTLDYFRLESKHNICFQRSPCPGIFREDELKSLQGLVPHLRRCVLLTKSVVLLRAGLSIKRTAAELSVSVNTIQFHLRATYTKTGVHRQSELVTRILALSGR